MDENIQTIKIGDGKYILLIEGDRLLSGDDIRYSTEYLERWWNSDEKFCIVTFTKNFSVKVERLENG